jgi:hypothetical protein
MTSLPTKRPLTAATPTSTSPSSGPRPGWSASSSVTRKGGTPYLVAELFWHSQDAFKAYTATRESAEIRNHAEGCGTTFTTYTGDVAEV